jgi:hypothetical protein
MERVRRTRTYPSFPHETRSLTTGLAVKDLVAARAGPCEGPDSSPARPRGACDSRVYLADRGRCQSPDAVRMVDWRHGSRSQLGRLMPIGRAWPERSRVRSPSDREGRAPSPERGLRSSRR